MDCVEYSELTASRQSYDLVMDEQAKTRWQRAKPPGMVVGLPGYLVGGEWVGVSPILRRQISRREAATIQWSNY
jgi:hypothetical protein